MSTNTKQLDIIDTKKHWYRYEIIDKIESHLKMSISTRWILERLIGFSKDSIELGNSEKFFISSSDNEGFDSLRNVFKITCSRKILKLSIDYLVGVGLVKEYRESERMYHLISIDYDFINNYKFDLRQDNTPVVEEPIKQVEKVSEPTKSSDVTTYEKYCTLDLSGLKNIQEENKPVEQEIQKIDCSTLYKTYLSIRDVNIILGTLGLADLGGVVNDTIRRLLDKYDFFAKPYKRGTEYGCLLVYFGDVVFNPDTYNQFRNELPPNYEITMVQLDNDKNVINTQRIPSKFKESV